MKRDMDLIRQILLAIEAQPHQGGWLDIEIPGYEAGKITYHIMLLNGAGLIEAIDLSTHGGIDWRAKRLTWDGHEFLDLARNDTVWKKVLGGLAAAGITVSLPVFQEYLEEGVRGLLKTIPPLP